MIVDTAGRADLSGHAKDFRQQYPSMSIRSEPKSLLFLPGLRGIQLRTQLRLPPSIQQLLSHSNTDTVTYYPETVTYWVQLLSSVGTGAIAVEARVAFMSLP